ncbi:MAG: hypothetical protein Q9220_005557 [cf. Caloplaca sp. 1 TL-2023]
MDEIIFTSRLKLTLLTKAERGSPEFEWIHKLRSDEQASWWSIFGRSKCPEDTEKALQGCLPNHKEANNKYRVAYAVLETTTLPTGNDFHTATTNQQDPSSFIGFITLIPLGPNSLALPDHLNCPIPDTAAALTHKTLTTELGYSFLPHSWGKGYATESVAAVLKSCTKAASREFWKPFDQVWVRATVNEQNPASSRVMDKVGMMKRGTYVWTGKAVYLAGEWREKDHLCIFGKFMVE